MRTIRQVLIVGVFVVVAVYGLPSTFTDLFPNITCSRETGISDVPFCSTEIPCTRLTLTYSQQDPPLTNITTEQFSGFSCETTTQTGQNARNDGALREITIGSRTRRYCSFEPPGTNLPLVIFWGGSSSNANTIYTTGPILRQNADNYKMDNETEGFVFISLQHLNRHWPSTSSEDGTKGNFIMRDWENNEDFSFVDEIIDGLVDSGKVNPSRIYGMGSSNGCHTSQAYSIVRWANPTPKGNKIASVASYSCSDPFGPVAGDDDCALDNYPRADIPILHIGRDCDLVKCEDQEEWMNTNLESRVGTTEHRFIILTGNDVEVSECQATCGVIQGILNHVKWPSAHTTVMLDWLRDHPLESTVQPAVPIVPVVPTMTSEIPTATLQPSSPTQGIAPSEDMSSSCLNRTSSVLILLTLLVCLFFFTLSQ